MGHHARSQAQGGWRLVPRLGKPRMMEMMMEQIRIDYLENAMRQYIYMAVSQSVDRHKHELGDLQGLASSIAKDAALNAMEMFAAHCNVQLRLIRSDYERQMDDAMRREHASLILPRK